MFINLIIPCNNIGKVAHTMLDSILNQTFQDFHIVCVEDGSVDNTWDAIKMYGDKYPDKITLIRNPTNLGPGETRNIGYETAINKTPSDFIWMVDGDDHIADNNVLQDIFDFYQKNKDAEMISIAWTNKRRNWVQASIDLPHGPVGVIVKSNKYVPYLHENIQEVEDIYQHLVQWDSIPDDKIKDFHRHCYCWTPRFQQT